MTDRDINTRQNPYFQNAERLMYELGYLLRKIPDGLSPRELSADTHMVAQAVRQHANNGIAAAFRLSANYYQLPPAARKLRFPRCARWILATLCRTSHRKGS